MKINEVAKISGITVRTLHYYDEIGLLKPSRFTKAGYRIYDKQALSILQQILLFRELDFSLKQIKEIIKSPNYDRITALIKHKQLLIKKRERLDKLINHVDNLIKGEDTMSFKEFDMKTIEKAKQKYAAEVKERWGNTKAYVESKAKTKKYTKEKLQMINEESGKIFMNFAANMVKDPSSEEVQSLVKQWQDFITAHYYTCTDDILASLGLMYAGDERFKENIDKYADGLAEFISQAIEIYCA